MQGYGLDHRGFKSRQGLGIFLITTASRPALGSTRPPIQWIPGTLSLGVKRPGCEADHSSPSSAKVKNAWSYTSTPQYAFIAWCLVKAQGELYLDLYLYNKPLPYMQKTYYLSLYHGPVMHSGEEMSTYP
jgi:hypothetical protein